MKIAVFGSGMRECETALTENGTFMALTILRSTARVYSTGLSNRPEGGKPDFVRWHTQDSRMLGSYSTRCTLAVYPAEVSDLTLHNEALSWQIPLNVYGAWAHGTAPAKGSFMSVEGAVLSAVLEKENGMAVRVFADKDGVQALSEADVIVAAPSNNTMLYILIGAAVLVVCAVVVIIVVSKKKGKAQ